MTLRNTWISIVVCLLIALTLNSCKDDVASAGSSALLIEESVVVRSDTLSDIQSQTQKWGKPICVTPDSFLIGECASSRYGTIKANLLTQFAAPIGVPYPDNCVVDSAVLMMYYRSWYGNGEAPMSITAYELDSVLDYETAYPSNINISDFCQMKQRVTQRDYVLAAAHCTDSVYYDDTNSYFKVVKCPLTKQLTEKLFAIRNYSSQQEFNKQFKGLLISSGFGNSTALYIIDVAITLYYHYSFYPTSTSTEMATLNDSRIFYANSEVRQINHYAYADIESVYSQLSAVKDTNYIITPANMYTRLSFPMKKMTEMMQKKVGDVRTYVNMAVLKVDVLNYANNAAQKKAQGWAHPATTMMLIKESAFERFFKKNEKPNDTCALCSELLTAVDTNDVYTNYFTFDMSSIFADRLRHPEAPDTLNMLLVPVNIEYATTSSSYAVSAVKLLQSVSATEIRSAKCEFSPMDIEVVYSGFSDVRITR